MTKRNKRATHSQAPEPDFAARRVTRRPEDGSLLSPACEAMISVLFSVKVVIRVSTYGLVTPLAHAVLVSPGKTRTRALSFRPVVLPSPEQGLAPGTLRPPEPLPRSVPHFENPRAAAWRCSKQGWETRNKWDQG